MKSTLFIALITLTLWSCGHDPQREVPGHLEPGRWNSVVEQARNSSDGGDTDNNIEQMAKIQPGGYHPANIAVLNDAEVRYVWFNKVVSQDKESLRFDHWAAVKVRESSFVEEQWESDAILLDSLDDVTIDRDGNVVGKTLGPVTGKRASYLAPGDPLGKPYTETRNQNTRVTVVEDNGGRQRVVGDQVISGSQANGGLPDSDRVRSVIDRINQNLRSSPGATGTSAGGISTLSGPASSSGTPAAATSTSP